MLGQQRFDTLVERGRVVVIQTLGRFEGESDTQPYRWD